MAAMRLRGILAVELDGIVPPRFMRGLVRCQSSNVG
jgi:hypothetical protein